MDLEQKYKEETGFSVGKIHEIGTTYYSDDYVKWLEKAITVTHCCKSDSELLSKRPDTSSTWECFNKEDKQQKGNV